MTIKMKETNKPNQNSYVWSERHSKAQNEVISALPHLDPAGSHSSRQHQLMNAKLFKSEKSHVPFSMITEGFV